MNNKIIFVDIDGTLVRNINKVPTVPKSSKIAIDQARKNGHKVFLSTGRSLNKFDCYLYDIQFDGFIGGAGVFAVYNNDYIYHYNVPKEYTIRFIDYCKLNDIDYFIETNEAVYVPDKYLNIFKSIFRSGNDNSRINNVQTIENIEYEKVNKYCYLNSKLPINQIKKDLGDIFHIEPFSYKNDDSCGEVTLPGFDKAFGVKKVIEYLNIDKKDTIAIGDGDNDICMIKYCDIGIAMGNSNQYVKDSADYVTDDIFEDGLYNAFKHFNLI